MGKPRKPPRYALRARVLGRLTWLCPICAHFNQSRLSVGRPQVQCGNRHCRRRFLYGVRLLEPPAGALSFLADQVVPDYSRLGDPLPAGELVHRAKAVDQLNFLGPEKPEAQAN